MVVTDANVLLYAVDTAGVHHEESLEWLERSLHAELLEGLLLESGPREADRTRLDRPAHAAVA